MSNRPYSGRRSYLVNGVPVVDTRQGGGRSDREAALDLVNVMRASSVVRQRRRDEAPGRFAWAGWLDAWACAVGVLAWLVRLALAAAGF